ncbi:MAG: cobalamin biosynthesis protein CbiG [Betaproteobacteria bacterium]|nr:cobalamin biosynthesis protein CbiG [Betaproteobacteria bacterium]
MSHASHPPMALVAITRHGLKRALELITKVPEAHLVVTAKFAAEVPTMTQPVTLLEGPLSQHMEGLFGGYQTLVLFISLGAVVRLIAPHLQSKEQDPGVIVIDDAARFVIPVLSGHVGGANAQAERLARLLGAEAVLTTASDVGKTIPVDILGRELGWQVEAPKINITRVSAHVVNQEPIAFIQEAGSPHWWTRPTPLPANIHCFDRFEAVDCARFKGVLWVTQREIADEIWVALEERLVVYRPPRDDNR